MIYHIDQTTSTNDEARGQQYGHMDIIWAEHQTAGRGQRGHVWHSVEGENLTFSVVLTPRFLPIVEQFLLSEVVALALVDTLADYGVECRIKWTNDIYAGDRKIVGVLIEHSLSVEHIERTVVGVGIMLIRSSSLPTSPTLPLWLRSAANISSDVPCWSVLWSISTCGIVAWRRAIRSMSPPTIDSACTASTSGIATPSPRASLSMPPFAVSVPLVSFAWSTVTGTARSMPLRRWSL